MPLGIHSRNKSGPGPKAEDPTKSAPPPDSEGQPKSPTNDASLTDDEAIPEGDPGDTTGLLLERLQAWKHMCGYLEDYIGAVAKDEKYQAKEQEKILKTVSNPLKEGHHFEQTLGGIAGLFENIRTNTQAIANLHLETSKNLSGTTLPLLERLHSEIKNKNKELSTGAGKASKAVDKARNASQKHIELLGQQTSAFDSAGGHSDASHDPYLIEKGVRHRLNRQILEENNSRADLLAVQNSFQSFETHILSTVQSALNSFMHLMGSQADSHKAMYGDIVSSATNIAPDFEWKGFVRRNDAVLINPDVPPRTMATVHFPNQGHRSTKALIEGTLERKSKGLGALKGYGTGFYAVTPSGFLHQFTDDDDFRHDPSPEVSLYLPDCTVGAVDGPKFAIKGKDVSGGKLGQKMALSSEYSFKAHTSDDAKQWHSIIMESAGKSTDSVPSSPVSTRGPSGTQQQQPSPIDTSAKGEQQSGVISTNTPQSAGRPQSPITSKTPISPKGQGAHFQGGS